MSDDALARLAQEAGLLVRWEDAGGAPRTVSPDSLGAILSAMDLPCADSAQIADSQERLKAGAAASTFLTAWTGERVHLVSSSAARPRLMLEDGSASALDAVYEGEGWSLDAPLAPGYHRIETGGGAVTLAVAPRRGFTVADAAPGRHIWGVAAQLYSLRGRRSEPFGEFGALADLCRSMGGRGADALAISPVHALFAADPARFGPYAPSTRLFLNVLFADPSILFADTPAGAPGGELIDWPTAGADKLARLRSVFARFQTQAPRDDRSRLEAFRREGGEDLERHARFETLHAHFHAETGARGWQGWPEAFHDPAGAAVAEFAARNAAEVGFHVFLQWLADLSLARAQAAAKDAGMAVGLIADLAVGMDAGGSHAWSRPDDLLHGLSVGAPPDLFQPAGQDWGLAAFSPAALRRSGYHAFLSTLRAAMRHAGGVRIDHAMGLRRLWLTPQGARPTEGAYLQYPFEDMMRLIALESARARAIVVGEDLGTVPPGFREETTSAGMMGMRVLWFERDAHGGFQPPQAWSRDAMAMTSTHDLPTVAGWWRERDIDWMAQLGRKASQAGPAEERAAREADREALWRACAEAGAGEGLQPPPSGDQAAVDAAVDYVARSACSLAIVPLEDILGEVEQPNLPGTIDEHPNWRGRLPADSDILLQEPRVSARLERLAHERPAPGRPGREPAS
ncbi:4-alpha-glucanotransferase [Caulobacter sp. S45]|uniref:4-alpha-glucanotransferase n=1 Tax=Caulobacter sp. S45 TaxID=1641861 RepID=UPI001576BBB4|nr:4-alpha-glucanotransferase [Caulobacter sp. S45]